MSSPTGSSNGKVQPHSWWHIPDDISTAITLKQACQTYHYSRSSIMRKIYNEQIQGFKLGRRWYVIPGVLRVNTKSRKNNTTTI